jgi:HNH endonuclease/AP2 domain
LSTAIHALQLPSGHIAIVDADDSELVGGFRWFAQVQPHTVYVRGYPHGRPSNPKILLHRLLLPVDLGFDVDHINGDGLDNRRRNLRVGTRSQNNGNTRTSSRNQSGYKGVSFHKPTGRWRAYINLNHRHRHLGMFDDPWSAAQAYNEAAVAQWGEFAQINRRAS